MYASSVIVSASAAHWPVIVIVTALAVFSVKVLIAFAEAVLRLKTFLTT